jgi:hypothetical protein
MEQRYRDVLQVQTGVPVTEVAGSFGVQSGCAPLVAPVPG